MNRPLNFLHLTTFYPPYSFGGDAMYIYRLSHMLGDAGHQVDVVHCVDAYHLQHPAEPEIPFAEHPNVTRHALRSGYGWLSPLLTQQTGRPFLKKQPIADLLRRKRYDVIQYHNISLLGPDVMRLRPQNDDFVKLYMTHEHWLVCPMHVLWKFNERACEAPACLRCTLQGKRPPQLWRYTGFLDRASRHVDRFVSPSRFTARMHAERGFSQPVAHLPYFIERADADWQSPGARPQERPYVLFVGRLEKIKGLQTVIPLWDQVGDVDLLIVGAGTYGETLREQAQGRPNVKFLGALSQKELGALYYHAVATLVPSITYETFGIIIVESFARKTPVIVRRLGALPEVVEDSGGGFIYETDADLVAAVRQLVDRPDLQAELGDSGYRAFVRLWSPEAHVKLYFDTINQTALEKSGNQVWQTETA